MEGGAALQRENRRLADALALAERRTQLLKEENTNLHNDLNNLVQVQRGMSTSD